MLLYFRVENRVMTRRKKSYRQKTRIRKTKPNPIQKNSTEPEPKLNKYPNESKILVFKELKPNPIRTKIFWVPECIQNRFINLYINYFLDLMHIK